MRRSAMFVRCPECPLRVRSVFRPFSPQELDFVSAMKADHIAVPPRADIIRADEVGGPVYTLFEGWPVRYHRLPSGASQIFDIVLPGDMTGLSSATRGIIRHSVQAVTPVTLCVLDSARLAGLFEHHPAFALAILQTRVEEEQRADIRMALLGCTKAEQRIAYLMIETFERLRRRGMANGGSTCPFPLQRHHLADAVGLSRVHVARTLDLLRRRRLAEIQDGVLVMFDRPGLTALAGYLPFPAAGGRRAII
jgi:CRP/FNR family transcriptional regulator, anaerobic regulatory protein